MGKAFDNLTMDKDEVKFGVILVQLMKKNGLTYKHLSELSGIPHSTLAQWTSGKSPQNLADVKRLARVLEVPFHFLVFGEPEEGEFLEELPVEEIFEGFLKVKIEKVIRLRKPQQKRID